MKKSKISVPNIKLKVQTEKNYYNSGRRKRKTNCTISLCTQRGETAYEVSSQVVSKSKSYFVANIKENQGFTRPVSYTHLDVYKRQVLYKLNDNNVKNPTNDIYFIVALRLFI